MAGPSKRGQKVHNDSIYAACVPQVDFAKVKDKISLAQVWFNSLSLNTTFGDNQEVTF